MGALLSLERELAGVASLQDMSGDLLDSIQGLVGATGSTLFSFDQRGQVSTQGGSLERAMASYTPDLFAEDAMQQWSLRQPPSTFLSQGDHPGGTKFDFQIHLESRPYADFYRPLDIGFVMGLWPTGLAYGAPQMFGILLTTPHPIRPFTPQALAKLRHLETPFRMAAQRIARFRAVEHRGDVLGQLLQRQPAALVLWDPEGRLVWASELAQRQLESRLRRGDLERAAQLALYQLHSHGGTRDAMLGRPSRLRSDGGAPLLVAFSWIAGPDQRPWLLAELEECSGARTALAQLTHAEARVLRLLAQGLSNAEIGEQLRVSNETVKTHLKRIFAKLGVNSRAKAAHVAHEAWARPTSAEKNSPDKRS
jgi:DNA-binding CsgD family transcriptional regulator